MIKNKTLSLVILGAMTFVATPMVAQSSDDLPPNAKPGKCYAKCLIPDEYKTVTEQVLVKEAGKRIQVVPAEFGTVTEQVMAKAEAKRLIPVPAVYETVTEQVLVKEASKRLETIPPVYETVTEQVIDKPAYTKKTTIPPVYETVTEKVLVREAYDKWEKGKKDPNCLSANPDDCRVMCLVTVPAEHKTVTKQVIKTPARVVEEQVPATYKTVTKQVLKTPAKVTEIEIPAQYQTITKQKLKTPATTKEEAIPAEYRTLTKTVERKAAQVIEVEIPAEYATVTKTVLVKKGGMSEWKEVLCESQVTTAKIIAIQNALKAKGYDPGPIDNILGPQTRAALSKYQKANNLPVGRLDMETLRSLGVEK